MYWWTIKCALRRFRIGLRDIDPGIRGSHHGFKKDVSERALDRKKGCGMLQHRTASLCAARKPYGLNLLEAIPKPRPRVFPQFTSHRAYNRFPKYRPNGPWPILPRNQAKLILSFFQAVAGSSPTKPKIPRQESYLLSLDCSLCRATGT